MFSWMKRNFWNLFGFIGVISSFYFSVFHVPSYVSDLLSGRTDVIHESIISDVQEIIFNGEKITIYDIESLVKGKELKVGGKYRYNIEELLVQVEDRFVSNKFIPLEKRKLLIQEINELRTKYSPHEEKKEKSIISTNIVPWFFSGLGALISFLGAISLIEKLKKDREIDEDLGEDQVDKSTEVDSLIVTSYLHFEKMIKEILLETGSICGEEPNHPGKPVSRPDFIFSKNGTEYIVECKNYKKKVGLRTINNFLYMCMEHGKSGVFISSSSLTTRAKEAITYHNDKYDDLKVDFIVGSTKDFIKARLESILKDL